MKDIVSFPDFGKLDLRVGKVEEAEGLEESENLIRLLVDLGSEVGRKKYLQESPNGINRHN